MSLRCIDLGLSRKDIEERLITIGYWGDAERRRRNTYVLSPSAYVLNERQRFVLDTLSRSLYNSISKTSEELVRIARSTRKTHAEARFVASVRNCIRSLRAPHEHDGTIPPIIKVDLMQDAIGRYYIAEADVYNPRGFGYLALMEAVLPSSARRAGSGIAYLARELSVCARSETIDLIVTDYESYYRPSYEVLRSALLAYEVPLRIITEEELLRDPATVESLRNILILPETMYRAARARDRLLTRIADGSLAAFYPPTAYLGSKALLPAYATCKIVRRFLPETRLISRSDSRNVSFADRNVLLKGTGSSGHKNIIFSNRDPERFVKTLASAFTHKHPNWIVQDEVEQARIPLVVFDEDGRRIQKEYVLRLTAYIAQDGLIGIEATGREDGFVHGAPDCIQIPCIFG